MHIRLALLRWTLLIFNQSVFIKVLWSFYENPLTECRSHFLSEVSHAIELRAEKMTSRNKILTATQRLLKLKKSMLARIIDGDEQFKKNDVPKDSHYRFEAINQKASIFLKYILLIHFLSKKACYCSLGTLFGLTYEDKISFRSKN